MAIRTILHYPDPRLREKALPVESVTPEIVQLLDDMGETMYAAPGVGLAATQIGVNLRIFVIDIAQKDEPSQMVEFINPELFEPEGAVSWEEGCLSFPTLHEEIKRAKKIKVRAIDRHGKPFVLEAEGLFAVAIQHENDHLDGVLMIDKLGPLRKRMAQRKMAKRAEEASARLSRRNYFDSLFAQSRLLSQAFSCANVRPSKTSLVLIQRSKPHNRSSTVLSLADQTVPPMNAAGSSPKSVNKPASLTPTAPLSPLSTIYTPFGRINFMASSSNTMTPFRCALRWPTLFASVALGLAVAACTKPAPPPTAPAKDTPPPVASVSSAPSASAASSTRTQPPGSTHDYHDPDESPVAIELSALFEKNIAKNKFPKATANDKGCWREVSLSGDHTADYNAVVEKCAQATGMLEYAKKSAGKVHHELDKRDTFTVPMHGGFCYRIFAVADRGIKDMDILITRQGGALIAEDKTQSPVAIIMSDEPWCIEDDTKFEFHVEVEGEGHGSYWFGLWAKPKKK